MHAGWFAVHGSGYPAVMVGVACAVERCLDGAGQVNTEHLQDNNIYRSPHPPSQTVWRKIHLPARHGRRPITLVSIQSVVESTYDAVIRQSLPKNRIAEAPATARDSPATWGRSRDNEARTVYATNPKVLVASTVAEAAFR